MSARYAVRVRIVAASSSPMRRLYPATSVLKIAASLRSMPTVDVWSGIIAPLGGDYPALPLPLSIVRVGGKGREDMARTLWEEDTAARWTKPERGASGG